ncbi:MAG: hypothetical protein K1V96_04345 [Lachnospiraceae bacterium]
MFGTPKVSTIGFDYLNATELERMKQNLNLLYGTAAGTCPGDRNFGLNQEFIGYPINVAQNLFALEVIEKTAIYEDKAEVLDIGFEQTEDGNLTPTILIGKKDIDNMDVGEEES